MGGKRKTRNIIHCWWCKTLTSLIAAQRLYEEIGSLHIVIVVPRILADQWCSECQLQLSGFGFESSKSTDERVSSIADQITLVEEGISTVAVRSSSKILLSPILSADY